MDDGREDEIRMIRENGRGMMEELERWAVDEGGKKKVQWSEFRDRKSEV
jgi:hypothetical protein